VNVKELSVINKADAKGKRRRSNIKKERGSIWG
jgi:hypothetical protein